MKNGKLIGSLVVAFMLGTSCIAFADDQTTAEEKPKADEQSTAKEPVAKSGTVMAAHVASNADELAKKISPIQ